MKSFFETLMRPLVLVIVLLTMLFSGLTIFYLNRNVTPDIYSLSYELLKSKAGEVDLWLFRHVNTVEQLGVLLSDKTFNYQNKEVLLSKLEAQRILNDTVYDSLGFITIDGDKYLTNGASFNVSNRPYFEKLKNSDRRSVISMALHSKADDNQVVLFVSKVFDEQGGLKGYVSLALPLDYIEGTVTDNKQIHSTYIYDLETDKALVGSRSADKKVVSFEEVIPSNPDWRIVLEIPRSRLYSNLYSSFLFIAVLTISLAAAVVYLVRRQVLKLTKPLEELEQRITTASKGTYLTIQPDTSVREVNSISESYNQLVCNIKEQREIISEQEKQKIEAENRALYAQIKPHFLYNTLETIQAMAYNADNDDIVEAVGSLATFYRLGLSSDAQIVPLKQECAHILSYIEILQLRYQQSFTFELIDRVSDDVHFLKFIIQPLVENAVYHGVKQLRNQKGHIKVQIEEVKGKIRVDVYNTAGDISPAVIEKINRSLQGEKQEAGYGLFNVNERLKLRFGEAFGVTISLKNGEFIATILHPKI